MIDEQSNKAGPAANKQSRKDLCVYVTNLIRDALFPLTREERFEVLRNVVDRAQVEANQPTSDQIEIMISRAIRNQTGKLVAGEINDPNSAVSRSLLKNVCAGRIRG